MPLGTPILPPTNPRGDPQPPTKRWGPTYYKGNIPWNPSPAPTPGSGSVARNWGDTPSDFAGHPSYDPYATGYGDPTHGWGDLAKISQQYDAQQWASQLNSAITSTYNPQIAQTYQSAADQAAQMQRQYEINAAYTNAQAGFDARKLAEQEYRDVGVTRAHQQTLSDIANQLNALDANDIAARQRLTDQAWNNAQQYIEQRRGYSDTDYKTEMGYISQLRDLATQGWITEGDYIQELRGYAGRERDTAFQRAGAAHDTQHRAVESDATARGAYGSRGVLDTYGELKQQLNLANQATSLGYDTTMGGLNNRYTTGEQAFMAGQSQLANREANTNLERARTNAALGDEYNRGRTSYELTSQGLANAAAQNALNAQQQAAVDDRNRQLVDSIAREYGIRREEAEAALRNGLDQLGIGHAQGIIALTQGANEQVGALQTAMNNQLLSATMAAAEGSGGRANGYTLAQQLQSNRPIIHSGMANGRQTAARY